METFNFSPKKDVKRDIQYLDRTIEFETGAFQVQNVGINPIITFEAEFEGTGASLYSLEEFYLRHRKSEKFYFKYRNKTYVVRFTSNYSPTDTWGYDNSGKIIGKTVVTLTMRVVW